MPWDGANGLLPGREPERRGPGVAPGRPPVEAGRGRGPGVCGVVGRVAASSLRAAAGRCPGTSRWLGVSRCGAAGRTGVSRAAGTSRGADVGRWAPTPFCCAPAASRDGAPSRDSASRWPGARGVKPGLGAGRGPGRDVVSAAVTGDSSARTPGASKAGLATGRVSAGAEVDAGGVDVTGAEAAAAAGWGREGWPGGVGIGALVGFLAADEPPLDSFSLSRLSTGASTVEEADRTNSPMSFNMVRTILLSTPSSFASS